MKKFILPIIACFFNLLSFSQIPTSGLLAYWPFDGNANDFSGNNNNGTVNGALPATDRFGNVNKCYSFNGISSHIDVPNSSTIDMPNTQDFSISFWIKTKAANNNGIPLVKTNYGSWNGYIFFAENTNSGYCNTPGQLSFYVGASAQGDACADNGICSDSVNWYHIVGIHESASNQTYIYVNGILQNDVGSKASSAVTNNLMNLYFGACYTGSSYVQYFNGFLDGVRFYNKFLDQNEILALYNEADPSVGIKEVNETFNNLAIVPNPINGNNVGLIFNSKVQGKSQVKFVDNLGRVVLEKTEEIQFGQNNLDFNLPNLSSGIYNLVISNDDGANTLKFIKD